MPIEVRIEPHVGNHMITGEPVTLSQHRVFVAGRMVGYLNHQEPPSLILIGSVSQAEHAAAVEAIQQKTNRQPRVVGRAPDIPPEWLQDESEEEEDEDEQ